MSSLKLRKATSTAPKLAAAARGRRENVLYLAHQVVEKYLKALICHGGQPGTH
jgi:HEPN domain-containing protein